MCSKDFHEISFQERIINFNFRVIITWTFVETMQWQELIANNFLFLPYIHHLLYHLDHKDKQSEG